jgi:hypothetical protein
MRDVARKGHELTCSRQVLYMFDHLSNTAAAAGGCHSPLRSSRPANAPFFRGVVSSLVWGKWGAGKASAY